jgi:hypothetical protein
MQFISKAGNPVSVRKDDDGHLTLTHIPDSSKYRITLQNLRDFVQAGLLLAKHR